MKTFGLKFSRRERIAFYVLYMLLALASAATIYHDLLAPPDVLVTPPTFARPSAPGAGVRYNRGLQLNSPCGPMNGRDGYYVCW